MSKIKSEALG